MKFNSLDFLILLMATLLPFFALPARWRVVLLITSSMIFYAFWSVPLISLIVISAIIDYSAGRGLERTNVVWKRRALLIVSMSANLGILGYFKYSNFFLESIHAMLGETREARYLDIILPPGISFYTFQTMSYTIDVYRRQVGAAKSFMRFFLYVTFFPQLVAGPIERAGHLMTQLEYSVTSRFSLNNFLTGCRMIIWGMFKKVVFADYCALLADRVYTNPSAYDGWSVLVGTLAFTIQIYCDFSAYSEIARGSARMFGVDLMRNFDQPYLASSVGIFWKRWHISLSTWIRDYLFIPLGGSRVSKPRLLFNLTITMFLSGLWHGAAWNFVLWGLYHGALLAISAILAGTAAWAALRSRAGVVGVFLCWLFTQVCVVVGWILFRISRLEDFGTVIRRIGDSALSLATPTGPQCVFLVFIALFLLGSHLKRRYSYFEKIDERPALAAAFYASLVVGMLLVAMPNGPQFIYFQF